MLCVISRTVRATSPATLSTKPSYGSGFLDAASSSETSSMETKKAQPFRLGRFVGFLPEHGVGERT